jgi:ABC-type Zn uptake system ZnuABC Zn-binding protein ZnuA
VLVALLAAACADDSPTEDAAGPSGANDDAPRLRVVTTVAPLTSIIANVAGPDVAVIGLVPEGVNSHTFEPPPSSAATLTDADVVFLNGLGLEDPTEELALDNVEDPDRIVSLGDAVLPEDEWIFDFSFPEEGGVPNPHLWTDPTQVRAYAEVVHDTLVDLDPDHAATYRANFDAFTDKVDELDRAVRTATETVPAERRILLTYHDAYAYFAETYGWTVIGAIQPSDFAEPSAGEVADLVEQIRAEGVEVIFGSEVFPSPVLEQLAAETGATYVDDLRDDDLPGSPGEADHSWLGLMVRNYVTMVEAFGGDASALEQIDTSDVTATDAHYPQ